MQGDHVVSNRRQQQWTTGRHPPPTLYRPPACLFVGSMRKNKKHNKNKNKTLTHRYARVRHELGARDHERGPFPAADDMDHHQKNGQVTAYREPDGAQKLLGERFHGRMMMSPSISVYYLYQYQSIHPSITPRTEREREKEREEEEEEEEVGRHSFIVEWLQQHHQHHHHHRVYVHFVVICKKRGRSTYIYIYI